MNEWMKGMVRGYKWKMRMSNGAVFEWWTPSKVTRLIAVFELLEIANYPDNPSYDRSDIEAVWMTKNIR